MKRKIQIKILSIMSIVFLLLSISDVLLSQNLFTHFNEKQLSPNQLTILKRLQSDSSTISLQVVKVNTNLFKNSNSVNLNLSSTKNSIAVKQKLEKRSDSDFSWFATIPEKNSDIIISVYKDAVVGYMVIDNECYNLHSLGEGLNALVHTDPSKYPPCGNSPNQGNYSQNSTSYDNADDYRLAQNNFKSTITTEKSLTTNTIIRVLVAYTENAKMQAGGENSMNALIENSRASANDAFDNSDVSIELELAHRIQVDHDESSNTNYLPNKWCPNLGGVSRLVTLEQFQNPSDGEMDEINVLREAYAADICVLITTNDIGFGGQSYEINVDEDEAFCVVRHDYADAAGLWSFTHEIGHLLGGRHQISAYGEFNNDECDEPYEEAHGYSFDVGSNEYRTMMNAHTQGTRIKHFANPLKDYQGVPTGNYSCSNLADVFIERGPVVSRFRTNHKINEKVTLTEDLEIQSGLTLTVQPDVIVEFDPGIKINIYGTMSAQGTPSQPITFTSSSSTPQPGDWYGIVFDNANNNSTIKHCTVEYAVYGIKTNNTNLTIEQNTIKNNSGNGINCYNASPSIYHNTIESNGIGILCGSTSSPYINNNYVINNASYGIYCTQTSNPDIRHNEISGNDPGGVCCLNSSNPMLVGKSGSEPYGANKIISNGNSGVLAFSNSNPNLGFHFGYQAGYNDIYDH